MTAQTKTATTTQNISLWQKLLGSVSAFGQAMDYDPNEYTYAAIERLSHEDEQLETRVSELENTGVHRE